MLQTKHSLQLQTLYKQLNIDFQNLKIYTFKPCYGSLYLKVNMLL